MYSQPLEIKAKSLMFYANIYIRFIETKLQMTICKLQPYLHSHLDILGVKKGKNYNITSPKNTTLWLLGGRNLD